MAHGINLWNGIEVCLIYYELQNEHIKEVIIWMCVINHFASSVKTNFQGNNMKKHFIACLFSFVRNEILTAVHLTVLKHLNILNLWKFLLFENLTFIPRNF